MIPTHQSGVFMNTTQEQYVVDSDGKRKAVILPTEQYEQILEDLHDLAVLAERRGEDSISITEMKQRLEKDGLL